MMWLVIILFVIILIIAASCVKIVPQSQAYILERLGVYKATWGSGVHSVSYTHLTLPTKRIV